MKKKFSLIFLAAFIGMTAFGFAQTTTGNADQRDTTKHVNIKEVEIALKKKKIETDMKMVITVDEFLASSEQISFIKRGAYAWEPLLNNMSSERSTITIDGMHVFGACTDKMDPVTSYVESNNLAAINITSGQEGSMHGSAIAGSIDLQRKSTPFGLDKQWSGAYQTGFEFNNRQFFNLGNLSYSGEKFVTDGSISWRKSGNYYDGNNALVQHSQFRKFNSSLGLAYKTGPLSSLRVDAIYDQANDVGYPALPMDLWLSRAIITSASYKQLFEEGLLRVWDSKVYYNAIEHYMDDTTRPENQVHMDMPGWSTTYGLVSGINLTQGHYSAEVQLNVYNNVSIAEMTMYPHDRSNKTMFAYSWPWVTTRFAGLSVNHAWHLSERGRLSAGGSLGWNYNHSKYVEFNRIFYPDATQEKNRLLPGLHASYQAHTGPFNFSVGTGYGHRAPSVSEAYGYYIYNSFDRYDYIGNPDLPNEVSYEVNASASFKKESTALEARINYFHIQDYIVGQILNSGSPMNYESVGVKGYVSLDYARLFNVSLTAKHDIVRHLHWKGTLMYARAKDNQGDNLPFIRPLSYLTTLHYMLGAFGVQTSLNGDFAQRDFSPIYGEDRTPAYTVWNISADYAFTFNNIKTALQIGAENLLNTHYSTYADWGNIPRMGRNFFTSLTFNF